MIVEVDMWKPALLFFAVVAAWVTRTPVAFAADVVVAPSPPAIAPDRLQLEKRLESVKTLLETSSAAKQIKASGSEASLAEHAKALEMWNQAKQAFDAGDLARTQKLLLEAPKLLFAAARHASPEQVVGEKLRSDYVSRRDSVSALLSAQKRISDEKGKVSGAAQVADSIGQLLIESDKLADGGKYKEARAVADKAYLLAKASVGEMRAGDTLVRSLNFANKEEEYKYEIDRNDSLGMLYKVLIEQKGSANQLVLDQVKKGQELRIQAEKAAAARDHAAGVKLLEESTTNLIRAIRSAGIFIPG
jgi:hypothetical protein